LPSPAFIAAWLVALSTTSHKLTHRELIEMVGEEVILQEREREMQKPSKQMMIVWTSSLVP